MKIFNWVHRKFHHKDGFDRNVKKITETESQVLLENVTLVDQLGGILSIGTFGFDPSADFDQKIECPVIEKDQYNDEDDDDNEFDDDDDTKECDDEELNPLMFTAFDDENALKADMRAYEIGFESEELEDDMRSKKRVTLADLFVADSDLNAKQDHGKVREDSGKKVDVHAKKKEKKKKKKKKKKLVPRDGDDDTRPMKKLYQLMRRMMKRKIHPDLEGKFEKMDGQMKPTTCRLIAADGHGANESVSLLQTKDSVV